MGATRLLAKLCAVLLLLVTAAACGGSGSDGDANDSSSEDASACRDYKAMGEDDEDLSPVIAKAKGKALKDALVTLDGYPEEMGFDQIGKVAITYEKIRAACDEAGVSLESFEDLMGAGGEDLSECPEADGQEFTYDQVVKMNSDGCMQSDGSTALTVYGGKCPDGRQFAYKNLGDVAADADGEDDYAYVVVAPGKSTTVVLSPNGTSDALLKLQMDCSD